MGNFSKFISMSRMMQFSTIGHSTTPRFYFSGNVFLNPSPGYGAGWALSFVAAFEGACGRLCSWWCRPRRMAFADGKVWTVFQRTFSQVQFLLDHNRLLIKEINVNQESQIPESLSRNVLLIKELNHNIKTFQRLL